MDKLISTNDITEKKLKNASILNIDLKRFKGYSSEVDIYTFREEFKKIVEPNVQKQLMADCLKKNYLTGGAYNLVAKMDKIDEIWERLISTFGNTQLLLQNKISSLEKFASLEKAKDDEKIAFALSGLLNVMADLKKLAATYKLEGNLYYGGGLQRILRLIGEQRERKFLKVIARANLDDKEKWLKLESVLENERTEREMFVINEKTKLSLGLSCRSKSEKPKDKSDLDSKSYGFDAKSKDSRGFVTQSKTEQKCLICDDSKNHVMCDGRNGQSHIEYFACKKFVDLNPFERMKIVNEKSCVGSA